MNPLIAANGLSVRIGGTTILENVTCDISSNEIVTIVGPNGSGKTTLVRALLGLADGVSGQITRKPNLKLGYVPQKLYIDQTMPLNVDRFLKVGRTSRPLKALDQVLDVDRLRQKQIHDLSGGQFQRVLFARALRDDPDLLVLDEVTRGLDQNGAAEFYQLVEQVRNETGCGVLMVSHDLHVVMAASDRVLCLNGHICCAGTPQHVASAPEYRAMFGSGTKGALALYRHEHNHAHHDH